jgi:hypothetical protein
MVVSSGILERRRPAKRCQGYDLIEGIFHGRIAQVIEELHAMEAQHDRKAIGWPALLALWVIMRRDFLFQALPGSSRE